jgi:putative acetyltransferase
MNKIHSDIYLRAVTNDDSHEIKNLVFKVLAEYKLKSSPSLTDSDLENIEASYLKRGGLFDVLVCENKIVGCVGLYPKSAEEVELRKMYFEKSIRGKGVGKKLLEYCIEKAAQLGFKTITLETASVLVEAIALYKKYGFKEFYPEHLSDRCDQAFMLKL